MTDCVLSHSDPVEAQQGFLCLEHWSRLRSSLLELPAIVTWLEVNIAAGGNPGERVSGTREDPIPLRLDVLDLIGPDSTRYVDPGVPPKVLLWEDGVCVGVFTTWPAAVEARWAEIVDAADVDADVHRWQVRVTEAGGLDQRGADSFAAPLFHWARIAEAEGGFDWLARPDVTGVVDWLARHLSWVVAQPWVDEFATEVAELSRAAHRLAPWRPEIRRDPDPCTVCGRCAVVLHIAAGESRCEAKAGGCGRRQPLSDYVLAAVLPAARRSA